MDNDIIGNQILRSLLSGCDVPVTGEMELCDQLAAQCLDALPVMLMVLGPRSESVFFNRAAYCYFGPQLAWVKTLAQREQLVHSDDLDAKRATLEKMRQTGQNVSVDLRVIRADYAPRWHRLHITPLFDKIARIVGSLVTAIDIHEHYRGTGVAGRGFAEPIGKPVSGPEIAAEAAFGTAPGLVSSRRLGLPESAY